MIIVSIAVGSNWVGNGIVSYYLSPILTTLGISSTSTQLEILIGLHIWNRESILLCLFVYQFIDFVIAVIISVTASLYVDQAGRRPLWLASTGGMLISFCCVMGLSGAYASELKPSLGVSVIPFLFLFYGGYDLAWTSLGYSYVDD